MEYRIDFTGAPPDPLAVEDLLRAHDPSALVDRDPYGRALRVATVIGAAELAALLGRDIPLPAPHQLTPLPSVCCGGCSG